MRRRNAVLGVLGLVVVVGVAVVYFRYRSVAVRPEALDLSRHVTGTDRPLDEQGHLDLAHALPGSGAEAPPPEENAVVAFLPLVGTDALWGDRKHVLRQLKAPPGLPEKVERPARPSLPYEGLAEADEEQLAALRSWLAELAPALEAFVEATRRPSYWCPHVLGRGEKAFPSLALPTFALNDLTLALTTRAELRLIEGDWRGGWDDLQAMLRLHALTDVQAGFIGGLVRSGFLRATLETLLRGLRDQVPPPELGQAIAETLARRTPEPTLSREWEFERVGVVATYLTTVLSDGMDPTASDKTFAHANRAVQAIHATFDKLAPWMATTSPENAERLKQHAQLDAARVKALTHEYDGLWGQAKLLLRTWWQGDAFVGQVAGECVGSMAAVVTPIRMTRALRDESNRRTALLALALRKHKQEHGAFPATLDGLSPEARAPLAANPLGVGPTPYRLDEQGCVLGSEATEEFALHN